MSEMNQISVCEVCGSKNLEQVMDLGNHPMCDDLIPVGDSRECVNYPIVIMYCESCRTAHQQFQVPKLDLFPESYHYRSRFTSDVLKGMKSLVLSCEENFGSLDNKMVLDIGCNDGSLLDFFRDKGAKTFGIEPTGACSDASDKGHLAICDYLSVDLARRFVEKHGNPDIITFTNVFAHIEDLKGVLDSLKLLKKESTKIVIENHYLGSVLDGNQFDTFYHEHPRTYSYTSFVHMASAMGILIEGVEFPSRYGGNIRVYMGTDSNFTSDIDLAELDKREEKFSQEFLKLRSNIKKWQTSKKTQLELLVQENGKLKAKAFPGRAAILIQMLGLNTDHISAVYEKPGSLKIGNYLPGTRIPICSDEDLFNSEDMGDVILNFAWHIPQEIRKYLKSNNYTGRVLDILSKEDF